MKLRIIPGSIRRRLRNDMIRELSEESSKKES